ncbi:cytochrome P450 [Mycena alexandri]|uniref:Cytochrome P450 n=1 Tax=Mycena alexandri TaxID=1745969 RepID=A0AAD6S9B7_9AGAR|nr:cytochrome P450 [Mycena alexandri]
MVCSSSTSISTRIRDMPPGVAFIASILPALFAPPIFTVGLLIFLQEFHSVSVPTWAAIILSILSIPGALTLQIQYRDYTHRRDAAALGAVLPPELDSGFGGISTVLRSVRDVAVGFPGQLLSQRCDEIGSNTCGIRVGWKNRVFTCEPQYIKSMLSTQFSSFEKGKPFRDIFNPLLGTGVFAADGSMWKFHRDMTRPFFEKQRISDFDIFDKHVEDAINQMKTRLSEGHPLDFQELIGRVTLDSASDFLFGHDFQSLATPLSYPFYITSPSADAAKAASDAPKSFAPAFLEAQDITALRVRYTSFWPLAEFWHDKIKEPMRTVEQFLDPILEGVIAKRREARSTPPSPITSTSPGIKSSTEPETLLEHLIEYTDDVKVLRDELLNISVAGRDTVTCLTTFTVYMLAEHPEVLSKLRQEIFEHVGEKGRPSAEDIKGMKYLRAVLNEVLRLYPPVPLNIRTSIKGVVWPAVRAGEKPIYIPPGTMIPYGPIVMHRRKDLWGPDALEFDPERFIDARLHKYLVPNPFIFLPFNGGPRICLGQQFAYQEASFILIRLLQAFSKISLAPNAQPPDSRVPDDWKTDDPSGWKRREKIRPKSSLAMFVMGGLWVTMEE